MAEVKRGLLGRRTMQKDVKVGDRYQAETEIIKVIQQERLSLRHDIYWHARSISNAIISACTDGTVVRSRQAKRRQLPAYEGLVQSETRVAPITDCGKHVNWLGRFSNGGHTTRR